MVSLPLSLSLDYMFMHADSDELSPNGDPQQTILARVLLGFNLCYQLHWLNYKKEFDIHWNMLIRYLKRVKNQYHSHVCAKYQDGSVIFKDMQTGNRENNKPALKSSTSEAEVIFFMFNKHKNV